MVCRWKPRREGKATSKSWGEVSPEDEAGFVSSIFFWWMLPLLRLGRRRPLQADDLYPVTKNASSTEQADRLERTFKSVVEADAAYERLGKNSWFSSWRQWKGSKAARALAIGIGG